MGRQEIYDVEIDLTLENGGEIIVVFQRNVTYRLDSKYGADADGNRGMPTWFLEEDSASGILIREGQNFDRLENKTLENQKMIKESVDEWMQANEADVYEGVF